jgi:hypothetical protein
MISTTMYPKMADKNNTYGSPSQVTKTIKTLISININNKQNVTNLRNEHIDEGDPIAKVDIVEGGQCDTKQHLQHAKHNRHLHLEVVRERQFVGRLLPDWIHSKRIRAIAMTRHGDVVRAVNSIARHGAVLWRCVIKINESKFKTYFFCCWRGTHMKHKRNKINFGSQNGERGNSLVWGVKEVHGH